MLCLNDVFCCSCFSGCDQKHEEEMDPEEIYKNFVLRVSTKFASFFVFPFHFFMALSDC